LQETDKSTYENNPFHTFTTLKTSLVFYPGAAMTRVGLTNSF